MEVLERMFIYLEEEDYLQNRCCAPVVSCEVEKEVPNKSILYHKIC